MKEQIKQKLKLRLKMAGFILSLVGWFLLVVVPLELAGVNFAGLESFVKTSVFKWGLKIFVIIAIIFLIKGQKIVEDVIQKHGWLKTALKIIFWGGAIGWLVGLGSLLI